MPIVFHLRQAATEDYEAIQRVYCYIVGPPTGQERTWNRLIEEGWLIVAEVDGAVIGFGGIDIDAAEQLKWLYVLPECQGGGIGARLLEELEQVGWASGLTAIRLHAAPGAVEFYQRHEYSPAAEGDSEDNRVVHDHEGIEMIKHRL